MILWGLYGDQLKKEQKLVLKNDYFLILDIKKANHQELPSKRMTFIMEPLPRFELGTLALQVNSLLLTLLF